MNILPLLHLTAVLLPVILLGFVYKDAQMYRDRNKAQADTILAQQAAKPDSGPAMDRTVAVAAENAVYFPDIRIKLPLSEQAAQLVYNNRSPGQGGDGTVIDVSTASYEALVPTKSYRLACTPLRIAIEPQANPYNPHESPQKAVSLKDGRTLQIYPFNEDDCISRWQLTGVDSAKIADLFQKAESY